MINEAIGLGKTNVGKGTFGHEVTQFLYPSSDVESSDVVSFTVLFISRQ